MRTAAKAALIHLAGSLIAAASVAFLVFNIWYPHPYALLSGGLTLFLILITVDVICGPVLTLVLFNPRKPRRELFMDMSLVVLIQLAALSYGIHVVHQARPLFLVHEVDRFRVIGMADYQGDDVSFPDSVHKPNWLQGPSTVGIRLPQNKQERQEVMLDSVFGGRDYSQRPNFYVPYDAAYSARALARAKPLRDFIKHYPDIADQANQVLKNTGVSMDNALFLPVVHKQEWIAVIDPSANILGFLPGDGFLTP